MMNLMLAIHISGGAISLLSMVIPMLSRKGGPAHRRAGWVFVAGMAVVSVTSLMLGADRFISNPWEGARMSALFLSYLGVFTGNLVWAGVRVLQFKSRSTPHRGWADIVLPAFAAIAGIAMGIYGWVANGPLLVAFAIVGVLSGGTQLLYWLSSPGHSMHWWFAHMHLMLGGCIAAVTAFVVNSVGRIGIEDTVLVWIAPTLIGVPVTVAWTRYYARRFAARQPATVTPRRAVQAAMAVIVAIGTVGVSAHAAGGAAQTQGRTERKEPITFSNRIAPIVYANCVACHRPGEAAPFSLITYDDIRARGALIVQVTASRYMPPWHATHGYGEFKDERRLTDDEIADIATWVKQGMPEGDRGRMPPLPRLPEGWALGQPDLVLEMPSAFALPASGPDMFRNFVIPTGLTEDKWVRAIEIRPSARKVVHHVLFAYDTSDGSRKLDGADGRPGYAAGMAPIGLGVGGSPTVGGLGGWAVGAPAFVMPDGHAMKLPRGSDFILQTHFHLSGKQETERTRVGLYFADRAPDTFLTDVPLPPLFGFGAGLVIPARARDYTLTDSLTLPVGVRAHGLYAHAHYIAKEIRATAVLPDGTSKPLIWIHDWDFNWQEPYIYKAPVELPAGTRLDVKFVYDNSAENPRNPSAPPKTVMWGEDTFDEMASLTLLVVPVRQEDAPSLGKVLGERQRLAIQRGIADGTFKRMQSRRQNPAQ